MMKLALTIGTLSGFLALPAFAGMECNGSFFGYDFKVTSATANGQITGPLTLVVSQDGETGQTGQMDVTESKLVVGKSLSFKAKDKDNDVATLDATFSANAYKGQMSIGNSQGTATPDMVCTVN